MPLVPTVENLSNGISNNPTTTIVNNEVQGGAIFGKQASDLGGAIQNLGQTGTAIATDQAVMANQLRVDDAMNKIKQESMRLTFDPKEGYKNLKGVNALERPDGVPLTKEYGDKLGKHISDIEVTLGNDAQRRAFGMNANDVMTQFQGGITQHEGAEFKDYAKSVREGTISNRQQEIQLNYNKPEVVAEAVNSIKAAAYDLAVNQLGKSAEEATAYSRNQESGAHKIAIMTALENGNVTYANAYFQKYGKGGHMNGDDILAVQGSLNTQMDAAMASDAVGKATTKSIGAFQPSDMDRLTTIVLGQESGNRDFDKNGNILTSSAGAKGRMQVMDKTNLDPGYGVTPAKDHSIEERARVGRDYLKAMVGHYGDVTKGLAAYNAGPGAVDDAIKKAKAEGAPDQWLKYTPAETQAYAANGTRKFNAGAGKTSMPTEYEYVQNALSELGESPRAETVKATRDAATSQYKLLVSSVKQKEDQAVADGIREMQTNGGNFAALTPSVRANIPPDKVDVVRKAGINEVTNPVVYNELSTNPGKLMAMTDDQFLAMRTELNETDWKHFATQRNATGEKSPGAVNYGPFNAVLNERLQSAGIDPTPTDATDDAAQVASIRQYMTGAILDEQKVKGRQLTDQETSQVIDRAFALRVKKNSFWGGTYDSPLIKKSGFTIPSSTKEAIKQTLAKNGNTDPSDSEINAVYLRMVAKNQQSKKV